MSSAAFRDALILTGPTGSGKTELALELAECLDAEIVAMDSMTLYRGMDIGTAKPTQAERERVPHHLLDVLDPWQSASVAWWLEQAAACCQSIAERGRRALIVGGTALYLKALLHGLFDGPPADQDLRQRLLIEAEESGPLALHRRLAQIDPVAAGRLHFNDVRRVVRALEVWELTGRPISAWQEQWSGTGVRGQGSGVRNQESGEGEQSVADLLTPDPWALTRVFCLTLPRDGLYARINARVVRMMNAGLVDEVQALRRLPQPVSREASQALGYKETFEYLDGRSTLSETVARIQTRSRNFAKRQLTWFRHLPECRPITRELTFSTWDLTMNR
jgi:tRNA dimethylallyltransferase